MRTAFKCRAYPTAEQTTMLNRTFGCARVVWNQTLGRRQRRWREENLSTSGLQASAFLTQLKRSDEFAWLNEVSSVPLQQVLRAQQRAFANFFAGRARYPVTSRAPDAKAPNTSGMGSAGERDACTWPNPMRRWSSSGPGPRWTRRR
jgi:transposase